MPFRSNGNHEHDDERDDEQADEQADGSFAELSAGLGSDDPVVRKRTLDQFFEANFAEFSPTWIGTLYRRTAERIKRQKLSTPSHATLLRFLSVVVRSAKCDEDRRKNGRKPTGDSASTPRRRPRTISLTDALAEFLGDDGGDPQIVHVLGLLFDLAKKHLSPRVWRMFELHFLEEKTWHEVGEVFGITADAARMSFYRALARLREELEKWDEFKGQGD